VFKRISNRLPRTALLLLAALLVGCSADRPLNPSFPLRLEDARQAMRQMRADPRSLQRPVVVLGGIHDPGFAAPAVAGKLRRATEADAPIIHVSFFGAGTFDACRDRVVEAVENEWPSPADDETIEVDVVGVSMGGLVARHAARPRNDGGKRLAVQRLFTIATPHRGASLAGLPTLDDRVKDMRAGSAFLSALDAAPAGGDLELYCYARLGDAIVGEENTAPPGRRAWWVANIPLAPSHLTAAHDPRILADIARRLRGEGPFTIDPPASLPGDEAEAGEP
jgi:hypothetical protein